MRVMPAVHNEYRISPEHLKTCRPARACKSGPHGIVTEYPAPLAQHLNSGQDDGCGLWLDIQPAIEKMAGICEDKIFPNGKKLYKQTLIK